MSIQSRLHSIFTRSKESEVSYLVGAKQEAIDSVVETMNDMQIQSFIGSATGQWLDEWAQKFGLARNLNELDDSLRNRILQEVTNPSGTIPALEAAVKRALGEDTVVQISETYQDLRIFNISTYSGTGKYQDSDTVRLGVVKIIINKPPNEKLREEIYKTRASGVRVIIEQI
jgi:hypothetical protein